MRILLLAASALALSIGTQALAQGHGRGGGHGQGHAAQANQGGGHGARGRGQRQGGGHGNGHAAQQRAERGPEGAPGRQRVQHGNGHGNGRADVREARARHEERGRGHAEERVARGMPAQPERGRRARLAQRQPVRITEPARIAHLRWEPARLAINGCPPGLARKHNGCMPPGLARQAARNAWYDQWWPYPDAQAYDYDEGYLLRLGNDGRVASYVPLLGGALYPGQQWPAQYSGYGAPDYYADYYGLGDGYDYRYADGALYAVDPSDNLIRQVVALVTGDQWSLGQPMPQGYGVYNVPYPYRDLYYDTPDALYRYSDGYVYQVDPTTQLVQAAIQLVS